jgi:hypothetical protein
VSRKLFFLKTAKKPLIMRKKLCIRTLEFGAISLTLSEMGVKTSVIRPF